MNLKPNKKLVDEAINKGCKTVSELALYLKKSNKTLKQ